MQITLEQSDIDRLKPETKADIFSLLFPEPVEPILEGAEGFDWEGVVSFTTSDIAHFVAGCSEQTIEGLRVIADHGPIIHSDQLKKAGITNLGSFQGSCTKRARTVSGNKGAYLLAWDDWENADDGDSGHYAVTAITYQSLCEYFDTENHSV